MGILCWYFVTYRNIEWCLFIHHYTKTSCIVSMRNDSGYYYRVTHFWHRYFWKATFFFTLFRHGALFVENYCIKFILYWTSIICNGLQLTDSIDVKKLRNSSGYQYWRVMISSCPSIQGASHYRHQHCFCLVEILRHDGDICNTVSIVLLLSTVSYCQLSALCLYSLL